jgi:hypothetical protein
MYDELVKRLREEASSWCTNCCYRAGDCICAAPDDRKKDCDICSKLQAVDAIEKLSRDLDSMNEANIALYGALPRWIPVSERLPEDIDEEVLVCTEGYGVNGLGFVTVATYGVSGWLECWERKTYLTAVSHWMPLPEPPKEG